MEEYARILSRDLSFVKVVIYEVEKKIFFGEMTFYHFSGFEKFEPQKYDRIFGGYIKLGGKNENSIIRRI